MHWIVSIQTTENFTNRSLLALSKHFVGSMSCLRVNSVAAAFWRAVKLIYILLVAVVSMYRQKVPSFTRHYSPYLLAIYLQKLLSLRDLWKLNAPKQHGIYYYTFTIVWIRRVCTIVSVMLTSTWKHRVRLFP
jgi:hypothetical protein